MDALQAVLGRRSIRKYTDRPVSESDLKTLLEAAMSAPSANNEQPWHFIVITDRKILDTIPTFHRYSQMLKQAPLAIMVCGDTRLAGHFGYMVQDCSAATENILIAAHAIGLGAVWLGIYPRQQRMDGMRELLHLPDQVEPLALIAVGHPAENKPPAERFSTARIHRDTW